MALVTSTKNPQPVPHEPGVTFVFRPLSKRELREADEEDTRRKLAQQQVIRSTMSAEEWEQTMADARLRRIEHPTESDPRDSLEKDVLLKYGLIEWSGPGYDGVTCTVTNKELLDPQTYDWAVGVILDMNVRPSGEGNASAISSEKATSPES